LSIWFGFLSKNKIYTNFKSPKQSSMVHMCRDCFSWCCSRFFNCAWKWKTTDFVSVFISMCEGLELWYPHSCSFPRLWFILHKQVLFWESKLHFVSNNVYWGLIFYLWRKIFGAVFHMLRTGNSLEIIVGSYKLLVDLDKVFECNLRHYFLSSYP